jgi:type II secretory pathway component PulK
MSDRRGFALLAVLWVTVALATLSAGAAAHARLGQDGTTGRIAWLRTRWAAEACLAAARSTMEAALRAGGPFAPPPADTIVFGNGVGCTAEALDPSTRLHADSASSARLVLLDSVLRAEERDPAIHRDAFLTHDGDGRVNLNAAPREVLATLPGFGAEAVSVLDAERGWGRPFRDIDAFAARLSPGARARIEEHLPDLLSLVTFQPTSLVLRGYGWQVGGRTGAVVEEVVVPAGTRIATVQRRVW